MSLSDQAEQARLLTRELWLKSDEFYRANFGSGEQDSPKVETPGGLEIEKVAGALTVSAEYLGFVGDRPCDMVISVEYSEDIRDIPVILESWQTEEGSGAQTVPYSKFSVVVNQLMELFDPISSTP